MPYKFPEVQREYNRKWRAENSAKCQGYGHKWREKIREKKNQAKLNLVAHCTEIKRY